MNNNKLIKNITKFKFPHFVTDFKVYSDENIKKEYDILFYEATFPIAYPFRNRLYYLLRANADKFNIKFLPYSKHRKQETMLTGLDLANEIKKSWITIATKSINNLLLAKYMEIPMAGSVVCGDYPDLEDEVFLKDNMIYINNDMTDNEIIATIECALNDKNKLISTIKNSYDYFSNKYTLNKGG